MSLTLIQDLRYGDSGKGKLSGKLSHPDHCDSSVRAVGADNAGHVIVKGTRKIALHLLPAGCVHEGVDLVLGRGMLTNPQTLLKEIDDVQAKYGTDPQSRLIIAPENNLLFNAHREADRTLELEKGKDAVGTTLKGVGPGYAMKALRLNMQMKDLGRPFNEIKDRYRVFLGQMKARFGINLSSDLEDQDILALQSAKERLEAYVHDLTPYWQGLFARYARIVIEGAQGSNLSIDAPGYPYVTSSATTVNGHMQGAGIPAKYLDRVIGTLKAYDTRVGNGQFPTELNGERGAALQKRGNEFGSTTGRGRRVGWLDGKDVERNAWLESVDTLAVMKGDVLDGEPDILVAIGSHPDGTPLYRKFPGWQGSIATLRDFEAMPNNAQSFYRGLSGIAGKPIGYIGTGPENDDIVLFTQNLRGAQ